MSLPYNQQLIDRLVKGYEQQNGRKPFSKDELVAWAIRERLWDTPMKTKMQLLSQELGTALCTNRKLIGGRKIRQYHCIRRELDDGTQQTLWCHFDIATPEFLEQSFARRRRSLRNQNIQLHNDIVHTNEVKGTNIQMLLDYADDIADYEHALKQAKDTSDAEDLVDPEN